MKIRDLSRPLRMAWHLRSSQILCRLRRMAGRRLGPPRLAAPPFGDPDGALRPGPAPDPPLTERPGLVGRSAVDGLRRGEFDHLNRKVRLGKEGTDWRLGPRAEGRLWTITLHYHSWAYALAGAAAKGDGEAANLFRLYVSDWIDRCDITAKGARDLAWSPYAVATRIGWWCRSYIGLGRDRWKGWGDFHVRFLASLWKQAAFLRGHLEWDLRGNHLIRDAVGLAWAGRTFGGHDASGWSATAARLAADQVGEQILQDGFHFERSPMYHLIVMEDILILAALLEDSEVIGILKKAWQRMADSIAWARHPDGGIPLLNDAALGGALDPTAMLHLGERIGWMVDGSPRTGGRHFTDAGLVVWQGRPWTVFFDVGPVGPDYQPGHAHADSLTFECSFEGERMIVDPGVHGYDRDERREYDRSTAAHNTLSIDSTDSSEVWHIFRLGRRARPVDVHVDLLAQGAVAAASHDGYDHLPGRPRHRRRLTVAEGGNLTIEDRVDGGGRHLVSGGYLLAPGWTAESEAEGWTLSKGGQKVRMRLSGPDRMARHEERRPYHPDFGSEMETTRIGWSHEGDLPIDVRTDLERA